jgi:tricorn protease
MLASDDNAKSAKRSLSQPAAAVAIVAALWCGCATPTSSTKSPASPPTRMGAGYQAVGSYQSTPVADAVSGKSLAARKLPLTLGTKGYYRFPATDGRSLVFTAEGDLWRVPLSGGAAYRLTTHLGSEHHAALSPNGRLVAFTGAYEGSTDVYLMTVGGGKPLRLTFDGEHSAVVGFAPDGRVVYRTRYYSALPGYRLVMIEPKTRKVEIVPLADAVDVSFGKNGALFFTRYQFQGSQTKRYKGGTAQSLWRFDRGAKEAVPLSASFKGTSKRPMVFGDRVYFVSDRDGAMNLWSMDASGKALRQHTRHKHFDIQGASSGGGKIVYQLGADLRVFDVAEQKDRRVPITLISDFDQQREKWIRKPMKYLTSAHISPSGERVVLTSRGRVFNFPVKPHGRRVEVTRRSGVRYREAMFVDDETIWSFSDQTGEVELWKLAANGIAAAAQLTRNATTLYRELTPSPDGKRAVFHDTNFRMWIVDVARKKRQLLRTGKFDAPWGFTWSPDSRYLAFVDVVPNHNRVVYIYDTKRKKTFACTSERVDSYSPAWGRGGKWLYFLSDRHLVSAVASPWGPRQPDPLVTKPSQLFALALRPGYRSPFAPPTELTPKDQDGKAGKTGENEDAKAGTGKKEKPKPPKVEIAEKGLMQRLYLIPAKPGRYAALSATGKHLYYLVRPLRRRRGKSETTLVSLPITSDKQKRKRETIAKGLFGYELSANGKHLLLQKKKALFVIAANGKKPKKLAKSRVNIKRWMFSVQPAVEWRQMLRDAWRLERDFFYDPKLHGAAWPAIYRRHAALLPRVRNRGELADLISQMVGELQALHTFVFGGDHRRGRTRVWPASLGAHWSRVKNGYRLDRIFRADPNYPQEQSPLLRPEIDGRVGDVITHIDGASTLSVADARILLRGKAGRQVRLRMLRKGKAREVIVKPISPRAFSNLRYSDWELSRRRRVEKASNKTIGYVHLRAMGHRDYTSWVRNFYPVFHKQGLIIDVRNNRGGNIDSWILGKLLRRAWFYWQGRAGKPMWNMQYAFRGHLVVLCNAFTMSDGEAFAEGFRRLGLGKVIGTRTWGGEIWLSFNTHLVDRGMASAAQWGVYGPKRRWLIEGHGVVPDIAVDNLPHATYKGKDRQLEAAVSHLLAKIKAQPRRVPVPPAFPKPAKER